MNFYYKFFLVILIFINVLFAVVGLSSVAPETLAENETKLVELYRIRIENTQNGNIEASDSKGLRWEKLGQVLIPCKAVNRQGFTASKWGKAGTVVASAVNAIHIKTAHNLDADRGVIFSVLPSEQLNNNQQNYRSYLNQSSSIYTNIRIGDGIFGDQWSLFVGNLVYLEAQEKLIPLPYNYILKDGDVLVIKVLRPDPYPSQIIFENKYGGLIYLKYFTGKSKPIGQVLKPVLGIGRFIGTKGTNVGRIRANHNGVIDISTSPLDKVGGFQIIPAEHSESPEMFKAKSGTQWMIIAPLDALSQGNEGTSPFFSGYIMPRYNKTNIHAENWIEQVSQQTLVQVKYKDQKDWRPMPVYYVDQHKELPERYNTVLKDVEQIRILFPMFKKKQVVLEK
jgi:hypothetical protein